MDVLRAAWLAAGSPTPGELLFTQDGRCARCDRHDVLTSDPVVSAKWTGWSSWRRVDRPRLCRGCAWGYRTPEHRHSSALVTTAPSLQALSGAELVAVLSTPVLAHQAVVVPLQRNRKHCLPSAVWGQVSADDVSVPWGTGDAARLLLAVRLRSAGFSGAALARAAPDYRSLTALPVPQQTEVLRDWSLLDPWRPASPWLMVASLAGGLQTAAAA